MITYVIRKSRYGWSAFEVTPEDGEQFMCAGKVENLVEILATMGAQTITVHTTEGKA